MTHKTKISRYCLISAILFLGSCSSTSQEENKEKLPPPITQQQADSVIDKTGHFPARTNARAEMDNKRWVSTSFGINTTLVNGKKTYSIFLTDGATKIVMNYSGTEQKGITNTGDHLQASIIDADNTPYPCSNGLIEFTQFDTLTKRMSGSFKLYCAKEKDKTKTKNITNATFTDLTWK